MSTRRVRITPPRKRIRIVGRQHERISPRQFAEALGAEPIGRSKDRPLSPIGLIALREKVTELLQSTGGRPALEGSEGRQKIPLRKGDWEKLKKIADKVAEGGKRTTPGQVASVLLHQAITATLGRGHGKRQASAKMVSG